MPTLARLPFVTHVPILSRPIRTSIRCLRWLNAPRSTYPRTSPSQCRSLHLFKTARASTVLGMHKVLPFWQYEAPPFDQSDHRINLVEKPGGKQVAEGLSLQEVFDDHVKPGHMLYLCKAVPKGPAESMDILKTDSYPTTHNEYAITKPYSTPAHVNIGAAVYADDEHTVIKQLNTLREVHIMLSSPVEFWRLSLDKAYRFVEGGCPVEFVVRFGGKYETKKQRMLPGPADRWPWMHEHFPHLRPDVIMKSMPKGTVYLVEPFTDGRNLQWVMSLSLAGNDSMKHLTNRLLKVQKAVASSVREGKQGELPMAMRAGLIKNGNEDYSLESGRARRAPDRAGSEQQKRWGGASVDAISEFRLEGMTTTREERERLLNRRYTVPSRKALQEKRPFERSRKMAQRRFIEGQKVPKSELGSRADKD